MIVDEKHVLSLRKTLVMLRDDLDILESKIRCLEEYIVDEDNDFEDDVDKLLRGDE